MLFPVLFPIVPNISVFGEDSVALSLTEEWIGIIYEYSTEAQWRAWSLKGI